MNLHIWISLNNKLQPKLAILIFWSNLPKKGNSVQKPKIVNITMELCICELGKVLNFSLNRGFCLFGPSLPEKGFSSQKRKEWTSLNSKQSH